MKVTLLAYTPEPEKVVAAAARCCYSNDDPDRLLDNITTEKAQNFLKMLGDLGHASPLEHVSFTFSISGVSRSFLAQITRHRHTAFSVRSQRYCDMSNAGVVMPASINKPDTVGTFAESIAHAQNAYKLLIDSGVKKEDARFVLPEGTKTSMVVTMSARELLAACSLRCCNRAQLEIRTCFTEMARLVKEVAPVMFANIGPSCQQHGFCPEGNKCCGKAPTMDMLIKTYKEAAQV